MAIYYKYLCATQSFVEKEVDNLRLYAYLFCVTKKGSAQLQHCACQAAENRAVRQRLVTTRRIQQHAFNSLK